MSSFNSQASRSSAPAQREVLGSCRAESEFTALGSGRRSWARGKGSARRPGYGRDLEAGAGRAPGAPGGWNRDGGSEPYGHKNTAYVPGSRSTGLRTAIPARLYARAPQLLADAGISLHRRKPPHTASTMPRVDADLKLDFKDVLLRPKRSSLKSRAEVGAAGMPPSGWQGGSGCRGMAQGASSVPEAEVSHPLPALRKGKTSRFSLNTCTVFRVSDKGA